MKCLVINKKLFKLQAYYLLSWMKFMPFTDYSITAPQEFKSNFDSLRTTQQRSSDGSYYTTGATLLLTSAITTFNQVLNLADYNTNTTKYINYGVALLAAAAAITAGVCKLVSNNTTTKINAELNRGISSGFFKTIPDPELGVSLMSTAVHASSSQPLLVSSDTKSLVEEGLRSRAFKK